MKKYHKIRQAKDTLKGMIMREQFAGLDAADGPIYDKSKPLPTVRFNGTVKIHGSNFGLACKIVDGEITITPQSRTRVKDGATGHFGFVEWVRRNDDALREIYAEIAQVHKLTDFTIFGEWAGKGIQNKVGTCELDKFAYVFDVYDNIKGEYMPMLVGPEGCEMQSPLALIFQRPEIRMFSAVMFKRFSVAIDLADPMPGLTVMNELTESVEKRCPVAIDIARRDGVELKSTIGEGIVWKCGNQVMKTKGDKHSGKGPRMKADIDPMMTAAIDDFIAYTVTEERVQGVFDRIKDEKGDEVMMSDLGKLMPALFEDIMDEEGDAIINGQPIEKKMVGSAISNAGRPMFQALINKF